MKDFDIMILLPYYIRKTANVSLLISKAIIFFTSLLTAQFVIAVECKYTVIEEWNAGYKAEVSIINDGTPLSDWELSWSLGEGTTFNNGWNATFNCSSGNCSATPPSWSPVIANNQTYTFGFIADKSASSVDDNIIVNGAVCEGSPNQIGKVLWQLNGETSSVYYVSMKKAHTAEVANFQAALQEPALSGSIIDSGEVIFALDLNHISTGVDIRDNRLLAFLFETEFLPTAYFHTHLNTTTLAQMNVGEMSAETLNGELSLHGVRQTVSATVLILKKSATEISVSTIKPILINSNSFDMASGIEILRVIANLSSIGEAVPVYFQLNYIANTDDAIQPVNMPVAPADPSLLQGDFDTMTAEASLNWQDNSANETLFLVRRKLSNGHWQTVSELSANVTALQEALPDAGEFDYKVIALNNGVPSQPTNIERISVTTGNQLVRGQQSYQQQCAACHGSNGEGVGNFPTVNTERELEGLIAYITEFMPLADPSSCDQQCAEDIAIFIETLWITETVCNPELTPISYGARQLKILTRAEYQNSVEDLLGIDFDAAKGLSADTKVGLFTNNTYASIIPSSYSNYLLVAEEVAHWSAERGFLPALSCSSFDQNCIDQFMTVLAPKIFRRPLNEEEVTAYQNMASGSYTSGDVKSGIQMAIEGMLSSPQFLYRQELGEPNPDNPELDGDAFELTSYEMATFLAYTFTGSTPDQDLLNAAALDGLRTEQEIINHAQRLAGGAKQVMSDFVGSWLGTADLSLTTKDPVVWAGFENVAPFMKNEINETFSHILLQPDEQFSSLYSGGYTFLNETLANHYGISGVLGTDLQKIETVDRGGILAGGAFMARWGEAIETSPILRSVRVRRRMLCQDQPDPTAGTFAAREQKLAELSELLQAPTTTNRLKYHRLTEDSPCTNCHTQYINPLGFGMEDFDSVGRVRSSDQNGNPIDASGELYAPLNYSDIDDVVSFVGTQGLGAVLTELPSAQSCLPKQLFRYFRGVGHQDIDRSNPDGAKLSDEEKSGYACEVKELTEAMMNTSPRDMLERFGSLQSVRYRKAWQRD